MKHQLGILVIGTVGVWVLVVVPAKAYLGTTALVYSAVAAVLCLVPNVATLVWADRVANKSGEHQLGLMLGGSAGRMLVVLGGGLALNLLVPYFGQASFWVWLLGFYLLTLALDVFLIATARPAENRQ